MTDLGEGDWKRALKKYFTDRSRIMNHTFLFSTTMLLLHDPIKVCYILAKVLFKVLAFNFYIKVLVYNFLISKCLSSFWFLKKKIVPH